MAIPTSYTPEISQQSECERQKPPWVEHDETLRAESRRASEAYRAALKAAGHALGKNLREADRQSLRDALGALKKARAYAAREGDRYAREAVRLATLAKKNETLLNPAVTLGHIALNVCRKYGISFDDLKSPHRARSLVAARHEFFYLARTLTSRSYGEIGRWCGDRDHTTVMHGEKRHRERVDAGLHEASSKAVDAGLHGGNGGVGECSVAERNAEGPRLTAVERAGKTPVDARKHGSDDGENVSSDTPTRHEDNAVGDCLLEDFEGEGEAGASP